MIHIRLVTPVTVQDPRTLESLRALSDASLTLDAVEIESGPCSIESEYDEAMAVPDTLRKIVDAEREGVDAVVIDCMGDPGLQLARELVSIPVLGPAEVSFHTAAMLGSLFTFVTVLDSVRPLFLKLARSYGVLDRVASFRSVNVPVLEVTSNLERLQQQLCEHSLAAVQEDRASVIVLGCTGFVGLADSVEGFLKRELRMYIPVIDPIPLSISTAAAWVTAHLTHSRRTYTGGSA